MNKGVVALVGAADSADEVVEDDVAESPLAVYPSRATAHTQIRARTQIARMVFGNFVELNSISHRLGLVGPRLDRKPDFRGRRTRRPWVEAHELCMDSDQARRACQDRVPDVLISIEVGIVEVLPAVTSAEVS